VGLVSGEDSTDVADNEGGWWTRNDSAHSLVGGDEVVLWGKTGPGSVRGKV
jgi:hypothetical protein